MSGQPVPRAVRRQHDARGAHRCPRRTWLLAGVRTGAHEVGFWQGCAPVPTKLTRRRSMPCSRAGGGGMISPLCMARGKMCPGRPAWFPSHRTPIMYGLAFCMEAGCQA